MLSHLQGYVWAPSNAPLEVQHRLDDLDVAGYKGCGLLLFPQAWTPPFVILSAALYERWTAVAEWERDQLIRTAVNHLKGCIDKKIGDWKGGLVLRSSATSETLKDRGAHQSIHLPADYNPAQVCTAITTIFENFSSHEHEGKIAVVVQGGVSNSLRGHLSNERRVSKTVNQWMWEADPSDQDGRFNSQRSKSPAAADRLLLSSDRSGVLVKLLQQVGRWSTELGVGPVHLEWGVSDSTLWLYQIDVEDDQPELGIDPRFFLRPSDTTPANPPPTDSAIKRADLLSETGWPKIDKVRLFIDGRSSPYPQLCYVTGADLASALDRGRDIAREIEAIAGNHVVCRTDCITPTINKLNLPRTERVSASEAFCFMQKTFQQLVGAGANANEICFIIHKFIPARAAAWALADPAKQIVLVDSLWGLPDGLAYLSHDTFEYDVRLNSLSTEILRYKPFFLQEVETGDWKLVQVQRKLARRRSISLPSVRDVARTTHRIAMHVNKPVQIMWFCGVDLRANVGENIPWFMQDAHIVGPSSGTPISPDAKRTIVRSRAQLESLTVQGGVLDLEPEVELFRDDTFLDAVARVAREHDLSVVMRGSTLGHAYYTLQRKGVVVAATESVRTRTRQRQTFRKLVRDEIPDRILEKGERVQVAKIAKSESRPALISKLLEEAQELLQATARTDVVAELADLLEVIRALSTASGIDFEEVSVAADEKRRTRGSFERNVVLIETSRPSWKDKPRESDTEAITLKDLAHTESKGDLHITNYASVLAGNSADIILRSGKRLVVRLTGRGLEIDEGGEDLVHTEQLSFDFPRDLESRNLA